MNANNNLKDFELSMLELFIEAEARTYDAESYVVHKNIIKIIANDIKKYFPYERLEMVFTTNESLVIVLS